MSYNAPFCGRSQTGSLVYCNKQERESLSKEVRILKDPKARKPDPRVWIFLVVAMSWMIYLCKSSAEQGLLFLFMEGLMLLRGLWKEAFFFCGLYLGLWAAVWGVAFYYIPVLNELATMLSLLLFRLLPIYMAYLLLLKNTVMNELFAALEQMGMSRMLLIPALVVYRYAPTLRQEIFYVWNSMRMRGIGGRQWLHHPVQTLEMLLVPILIRSGKLADELAAAGLCRGLDLRRSRTMYKPVRFSLKDVLWCGCFLVVLTAVTLFHEYSQG